MTDVDAQLEQWSSPRHFLRGPQPARPRAAAGEATRYAHIRSRPSCPPSALWWREHIGGERLWARRSWRSDSRKPGELGGLAEIRRAGCRVGLKTAVVAEEAFSTVGAPLSANPSPLPSRLGQIARVGESPSHEELGALRMAAERLSRRKQVREMAADPPIACSVDHHVAEALKRSPTCVVCGRIPSAACRGWSARGWARAHRAPRVLRVSK